MEDTKKKISLARTYYNAYARRRKICLTHEQKNIKCPKKLLAMHIEYVVICQDLQVVNLPYIITVCLRLFASVGPLSDRFNDPNER